MKTIDIIIIAIIAALIATAVFFAIKRKKKGGCCGCGKDDCPYKKGGKNKRHGGDEK